MQKSECRMQKKGSNLPILKFRDDRMQKSEVRMQKKGVISAF